MAVNGDAASPSLSVETHVIVIVQDMNDNVPRFVSSIYKCNVVENVAENTLVQRVNASDADQVRFVLFLLHSALLQMFL